MTPGAMVAVLALLGVAGMAWMLRGRVDEAEQGGTLPWLSLSNMLEETGALFGGAIAGPSAAGNVAAFLRMIREAEGTEHAGGYAALFGSTPGAWRVFEGFADHPRIAQQFGPRRLWTSAAGAYQFMAVSPLPDGTGRTTRVDTWDRLRRKLGLTDFGPASQDRAAIELIDEAGALVDVQAGRFEAAVSKVRKTWASLPGAGYADQRERSMQWARDTYSNAGGNFA